MDMELASSCFGMEGSKMEGGPIKILGRATLRKETASEEMQWLHTRALTKPGSDRIGSDRTGLTKPGPGWTGLTKPGQDVIRLTKTGSDPKKSINSRQNSHVISLIEYGTERSKETFAVCLFFVSIILVRSLLFSDPAYDFLS